MKKLLLLFCIVLTQLTWAQNGLTTKVTVFKSDNNGPKSVTKADSMASIEHNCIKWNYSLLGRGVFLFNYEFLITGNLTAEIGLGLTYRDFIFETTNSVAQVPQSEGTSNWSNDGSPGINLCGEGGLRYYLTGFDNFEGFYVQGTLSYRPYTFPNSPNIGQFGTLVPGYTFFDSQFKIGYQYESRYSDITCDTYIGIGYRDATLKYYEQGQMNNSGIYQYVPQTVSASFPQFLFGAKIGYSF